MTSDTVDSLELREKVAAPLAQAAQEQLRAGNPLGASYAAEACLRIDRYRCSCIRDAGLVAQEHLAKARTAVKEKRLEDALVSFIVCRVLDPKAWDCPVGLADTLERLRRFDDAREVRLRLLEQLPKSHPRRASIAAALK